jgi:hypothetical protein
MISFGQFCALNISEYLMNDFSTVGNIFLKILTVHENSQGTVGLASVDPKGPGFDPIRRQ